MPLHKLNRAKKYNFVPFVLKTIYISNVLLVCWKAWKQAPALPSFYKTPGVCVCVSEWVNTHTHTQAHASARMAHTGTFGQTRVSLAGVKLVAPRSLCV